MDPVLRIVIQQGCWIGACRIIGGAVISWLVSLLVYGCGQILEEYREMKQREERPRRRVLEPQQREFV